MKPYTPPAAYTPYTKYLRRQKLGPVRVTFTVYKNAWALHVGWWRG